MDKRFFLLMIVFLIVGLVPTIICILYPPQLAIIEKEAAPNVHVGLNNWYATRDYPSADIPERLLQKVKNQHTFPDNIHIEQDKRTLAIKYNELKTVKLVQIYNLMGIHRQTTYLLNNENRIDINKLNKGNYLILLDVEEIIYLKEIDIL